MAGLNFLRAMLPIMEQHVSAQLEPINLPPNSPLLKSPDHVHSGVLLTVEVPSSATQSLLFQAAISHAARRNVLFISTEQLQIQPAFISGMPSASATSLSNVKFLYIDKVEDLMEFLAGAHSLQFAKKFELVVIDRVDWFVERLAERDANRRGDSNLLRELALAKLCAALVDAASYLLKASGLSRTDQDSDTNLILSASLTHSSDARIYSRFIDQLVQATLTETTAHAGATQPQSRDASCDSNVRTSLIDFVDLRMDSNSSTIRCAFIENKETGDRSIALIKNEPASQSQ